MSNWHASYFSYTGSFEWDMGFASLFENCRTQFNCTSGIPQMQGQMLNLLLGPKLSDEVAETDFLFWCTVTVLLFLVSLFAWFVTGLYISFFKNIIGFYDHRHDANSQDSIELPPNSFACEVCEMCGNCNSHGRQKCK